MENGRKSLEKSPVNSGLKSHLEIISGLMDPGRLPGERRLVFVHGEARVLKRVQALAAMFLVGGCQKLLILDGANAFDPFNFTQLAVEKGIEPRELLRRIRISRSFTAHQMLSLLRRLPGNHGGIGFSPYLLLGPLTSFYDENVPDYEAKTLVRQLVQELERLAGAGIPLLVVCQQPVVTRRRFFARELARQADVLLSLKDVEHCLALPWGIVGGGLAGSGQAGTIDIGTDHGEEPVADRKEGLWDAPF